MNPFLLAVDYHIPILFRIVQRLEPFHVQSAVLLAVGRVKQIVAGSVMFTDPPCLLIHRLSVEVLASLSVKNVLVQFLICWQLLAPIAVFAKQRLSDARIGERASQPFNLLPLTLRIVVRITLIDAPDPLRCDLLADVEIVFILLLRLKGKLDKNESSIAAVFFVQI